MKRGIKKIFIILTPVLLALLADRITKGWVMTQVPSFDGIFVSDNFLFSLKIVKSLNTELALSIPMPTLIIYITTIVITIFIAWLTYLKIVQNKLIYAAALSTILVSAISNLFDRIYYGGVVDFVSLGFFHYSWSIFNLADVFIIVGLLIVLYKELKSTRLRQSYEGQES